MAEDIPLKAVVVADRILFATDNFRPSEKRSVDEAVKSSTNFHPSTGLVVESVKAPQYRLLRVTPEFFLLFEDLPDRIHVLDVIHVDHVKEFIPTRPATAEPPKRKKPRKPSVKAQ